MTHKEALLFVGKCLTLDLYPERSVEIVEQIRGGNVVWEKVVWVSSSHFVLPAMYLQLERALILEELPLDLIDHMRNLTDQNRERNRQIMRQIDDVVHMLNAHSIAPVLLKGTAHLFLPLYKDIAERMIGDIDFLVEEHQFHRAAEILIEAGYKPLVNFVPKTEAITKHYPRLQNFDYPAAVEIHRQVLRYPNDRFFHSSEVIKGKVRISQTNELYIPSVGSLMVHNVLNNQINDYGYRYANLNLRQMYDFLMLSVYANPAAVLKDYGRLSNLVNAYLGAASLAFSSPNTIPYQQSITGRFHYQRYLFFLKQPGWVWRSYKTVFYLIDRLSRYIVLPVKSVYRKDVRASVWARIKNPAWYKNHVLSYLHYFGFRKKEQA